MTLAAADIHDSDVSAAIAATLATFHTKMVGGSQQCCLIMSYRASVCPNVPCYGDAEWDSCLYLHMQAHLSLQNLACLLELSSDWGCMLFTAVRMCCCCLCVQSKVMSGRKHQAGAVQLWERLRLWLELVQQVRGACHVVCVYGLEQTHLQLALP